MRRDSLKDAQQQQKEDKVEAPVPSLSGHGPGYSVVTDGQRNGEEKVQIFFSSNTKLNELTEPTLRLHTPLSDDAALRVGEIFEWPHVLESVARARRRCLGSMFPAQTELWGKG